MNYTLFIRKAISDKHKEQWEIELYKCSLKDIEEWLKHNQNYIIHPENFLIAELKEFSIQFSTGFDSKTGFSEQNLVIKSDS